MDKDRKRKTEPVDDNPPLDFMVIIEGLANHDPSVTMEKAMKIADRFADWGNKVGGADAILARESLIHFGFDLAASKIRQT